MAGSHSITPPGQTAEAVPRTRHGRAGSLGWDCPGELVPALQQQEGKGKAGGPGTEGGWSHSGFPNSCELFVEAYSLPRSPLHPPQGLTEGAQRRDGHQEYHLSRRISWCTISMR